MTYQRKPVEAAIRRSIKPGKSLYTFPRRKLFRVGQLDHQGFLLLRGPGESPLRLRWPDLEGIPRFLAERGWVLVSGTFFDVVNHPGTLDGYLFSRCGLDTKANWVAPVLSAAGVVYTWNEWPVRVRLSPKFSIDDAGQIPEEPASSIEWQEAALPCDESAHWIKVRGTGQVVRVRCPNPAAGRFGKLMLCEEHLLDRQARAKRAGVRSKAGRP